MPTLTIGWITKHDDRVCPICADLETSNYTWIFQIGKDPFPQNLSHPTYGIVWDKVIGSMAHGHASKLGCRCTIWFRFDVTDLNEKLEKIVAELDMLAKAT